LAISQVHLEATVTRFLSLSGFFVVVMAWLMVGVLPKAIADSTAVAENNALLHNLKENLDITPFQNVEMNLKEFCALVMEKFAAKGKDCPILVDLEAFKREKNPNDDSILDTVVRMPPFPKRIPAIAALQIALSQSQTPATFLIIKGKVIITTKKQASTNQLLKQTVTASFNARPLADASEELSAITGASIVVDGRLGEKPKNRSPQA
jgi:hypothetical protein